MHAHRHGFCRSVACHGSRCIGGDNLIIFGVDDDRNLRVDAQWGFSLNFRFAQSYYVGITGGVAFTPLASFGNKDKKIRIHRNTVAISLGYNF